MKKVFWIVLSILALTVAACGQSATPEAIPTVSLDGGNSSTNTQASSGDSVSAAAVVVPLSEARLSFTSVGRVTSVNVQVGDKVEAGQILVELDTTPSRSKSQRSRSKSCFCRNRPQVFNSRHWLQGRGLYAKL